MTATETATERAERVLLAVAGHRHMTTDGAQRMRDAIAAVAHLPVSARRVWLVFTLSLVAGALGDRYAEIEAELEPGELPELLGMLRAACVGLAHEAAT